jgi:glycine cleavage system aminomethyltransferase T
LSIHASPELVPSALAQVLVRAGAVFAPRHGQSVAVSYGSPAGELAACVKAAGIADASHLTKLEICGPAGRLADLTRHATGGSLAPGGVLNAAGAWWCGAGSATPSFSAQRVVVLCEPLLGARLHKLLRARAARLPGLVVRDRSREWAAITVIGAAAPDVLRALGVFGTIGDPRDVPPFTSAELADAEALWLLESGHRALAVVPASVAGAAWHAIERAGRPYRMCCVGEEAVARYELLLRRQVSL